MFIVLFFRTMNTVAVVIALALLVTVASGLGYNSYNRYPSIKGNSWNTWESKGGGFINNGGWNLGHGSRYGRKYCYSFSFVLRSRLCQLSNNRRFSSSRLDYKMIRFSTFL